jgi:hypothetical protein
LPQRLRPVDPDGPREPYFFATLCLCCNDAAGCRCSASCRARAEFDLVCEQDDGYAPLPLTRPMFHAIQHTDPRCPAVQFSADDAAALKEPGPIVEQIKNEAAEPA